MASVYNLIDEFGLTESELEELISNNITEMKELMTVEMMDAYDSRQSIESYEDKLLSYDELMDLLGSMNTRDLITYISSNANELSLNAKYFRLSESIGSTKSYNSLEEAYEGYETAILVQYLETCSSYDDISEISHMMYDYLGSMLDENGEL